jgi:diguanylate cyclase (GGDEF)-like protein
MLDMERRLQSARVVMFGALFLGFAACVPWLGWWPVVLVVAQVLVYAGLRPSIRRSARPEYPIAAAVVSAQTVIAAGVALTGASDSPVLILFLLGVVALPARFGTNGVVAGVVLTELLVFGSTAGVDPTRFAADPSPVIVVATATFGFAALAHALMRAETQKRFESAVDVLTGLPNRRGMEPRFEELRTEAAVAGSSLALLLCDLDLFKAINDRHGHQRGDAVLADAARAMRGCMRPSEPIYRIGGEEFLVLLPGCDLRRARPVAERIRAAVESATPGGLPVTMSVGAAAAAGADIDFDALFAAADRALYEAKRSGRNRVAAAPVPHA